jgi:hypothetical protein
MSLESADQGRRSSFQVNWKSADSYSEGLVMSIFVCLLALFVRLVLILVCACLRSEQALAPCPVSRDYSADHKRPTSRTLLRALPVSRLVRMEVNGAGSVCSHKGAVVSTLTTHSESPERGTAVAAEAEATIPRGMTRMPSETPEWRRLLFIRNLYLPTPAACQMKPAKCYVARPNKDKCLCFCLLHSGTRLFLAADSHCCALPIRGSE